MINPFVMTHKTVGTKRRSTITYYRREIEESSVSRGRAIIVSLGRGWRRPLSSARSNPGGDRVFLDVPVTDESPGKRSWKVGFNVSSLRVARLNCFGGAWAGVDLILPVSRHGTTFESFFPSVFEMEDWSYATGNGCKCNFEKGIVGLLFLLFSRDRCFVSIEINIENNASILIGV